MGILNAYMCGFLYLHVRFADGSVWVLQAEDCTITAEIMSINRGGALVNFEGLRGFLPGSHAPQGLSSLSYLCRASCLPPLFLSPFLFLLFSLLFFLLTLSYFRSYYHFCIRCAMPPNTNHAPITRSLPDRNHTSILPQPNPTLQSHSSVHRTPPPAFLQILIAPFDFTGSEFFVC